MTNFYNLIVTKMMTSDPLRVDLNICYWTSLHFYWHFDCNLQEIQSNQLVTFKSTVKIYKSNWEIIHKSEFSGKGRQVDLWINMIKNCWYQAKSIIWISRVAHQIRFKNNTSTLELYITVKQNGMLRLINRLHQLYTFPLFYTNIKCMNATSLKYFRKTWHVLNLRI